MIITKKMKIWIASFDIGKKNFAFCIEEVDTQQLQQIQNLPKSQRYHTDGTATKEFMNVLRQVCRSGRLILIKNVDLTDGCNMKISLDPKIFIHMNQCLRTYKSYWDKCSAIVVEQQMSFGKKKNFMAMKLGQHCLSYFLLEYATFKHIVEFPAYHKTKVFGAPPKMSKYQRKKWAVEICHTILTDREDDLGLQEIVQYKKKDDVSDIVMQLQSYKYLRWVEGIYT